MRVSVYEFKNSNRFVFSSEVRLGAALHSALFSTSSAVLETAV